MAFVCLKPFEMLLPQDNIQALRVVHKIFYVMFSCLCFPHHHAETALFVATHGKTHLCIVAHHIGKAT